MAKVSYGSLLNKAIAEGSARRYAEAESILTRIIAETDALPDAWLFLGRALHAQGHPEKAIPSFKAYLYRLPDSAAGWFYLGRSCLSMGQFRDALRSFGKSAALGFDSAELWVMTGLAELRMRRSGKALECLERAVALAENDPRVFKVYCNALYVHAVRTLNAGDPEMARQMLSFAMEHGMDGAPTRIYLSRAYRQLGRLEDAIRELSMAMESEPGDPSMAMQMAALYLAIGRPDEAMRIVHGSGADLPGPEDAPWTEDMLERWRAAFALSSGDARTALDAAIARIRKGDKDAAIRALAAQANYELGRYQRAANYYRLAAGADPASADFRMGLALSLWELGDTEGARAAARVAASKGAARADSEYIALLCDAKTSADAERLLPRAQELLMARPGDPRLMLIVAQCQYKLGMPDLAERWLATVLELQPDNELALLYWISCAESAGNAENAYKRYRFYLERYPDNAKVRKEFVEILMAAKLWNDAASILETGYAYGASGKGTEYTLALCYRNAGRYREAAARYRLLLKADPKNLELLLGLAFSLDKSGAAAIATELLERGAAFIKKEAEPYLALGMLYLRRKNVEKAVNAFTRASELAPADPRPLRSLARAYRISGVRELADRFSERAGRLENPRKSC